MDGGIRDRGGGNGPDAVERHIPEQPLIAETTVRLPAFGVEDPHLRPPPRRSGPIADDRHLRPLADDVPPEPDPRPPDELEVESRRLGERACQVPRQARRLEEDEEGPGPPGECREPMDPVRRSAMRAVSTPGRPLDREIRNEEIHRPALEELTGHRQALVERRRREDDKPFEPNPTGDRLHRVEATGEVEPGDDRPARLRLRHEPEGERRLAARVIATEREADVAGDAARTEDRIERGEPGGHDVPIRRSRPPWSCGAPAIPEGRENGRDIGGGGGHRRS